MLSGTTVRYIRGESWVVILVTPVMKRVQLLDSSKEMIFVDTTCSCEISSSSLTIFLAATKAGAIPVAAVIHSSQTKENYEKAFQLLKDNFPHCFGGRDVRFFYYLNTMTIEYKNSMVIRLFLQ